MIEQTISGIIVRCVPKWERYWAADYGPIWSNPREFSPKGVKYNSRGRWLSVFTKKNGRKFVNVYSASGDHKSITVAHLVALAWIGPPPEGKTSALHKNSDPSNDHYTNLYWGDHKDNARDCREAGGFSHLKEASLLLPKGENHQNTHLTNKQAREIFIRAHSGDSIRTLSKEFDLSQSCISDIKYGRSWKTITQDLIELYHD